MTETNNQKPAIFIGTDFNEAAEAQYPLDRILLRDSLVSAGSWAAHNGYRVVVRDHPAISGTFKYIFKEITGSAADVSVEPEAASISEIVAKHHPEVAVLAGGFEKTAADFGVLLHQADVAFLPLPTTGGVTRALFMQHKAELTLPPETVRQLERGRVSSVLLALGDSKPPKGGP